MSFPALAHDRVGAGTPVVLVHGIGHRRQAWSPVVRLLAEDHEVIAVDLTGFGESPGHPKGSAHNVEAYVDHLVANFRAWGLEKPHVAGNSLGGAVALELARRGEVASAVALAPASFIDWKGAGAALPLVAMRLGALLVPAPVLRQACRAGFVRAVIGWPLYAYADRHDAASTYGDALAMKRARGFEATAIKCLRPVFKPFRGALRAPVTIAWGTKDRILPYGQMARARKLVPQARYITLDGAGHVPMSDCPEAIAELIRGTIADVEAGRSAVA
ncbi:alpha/beta fold hydrolase [Nocardioides jejuensis]|uniref:alpha/beta fold hydrolase n=1 Tax=Nocardioides jejuensis TaxID=2502782 RepID=UPI001A9F7728|nr:alpha/beta hydrolase [Nocardioides jejuensis]